MQDFFQLAVDNVSRRGDTDIFPYPIENHILHDSRDEVVAQLMALHRDFYNQLSRNPPRNINALAPISYSGFRWATQIDPLWNIYFLGIVLSVADRIELARIPKEDRIVYSYRYFPNQENSNLFDDNYGWIQFMERSSELANEFDYVVMCDISEFYPRLGHHPLDNRLRQLNLADDQGRRIMRILRNFSNTRSFGLPIGGPAARMLSELHLNQVDRLLVSQRIPFCRFADDYHLFSNSLEDAYTALVYLSEKLFTNEGLSLQKSKTRILSGAEFLSTSPIRIADESDDEVVEGVPDHEEMARSLMRFSIRFDPYSPTRDEDYETLKRELARFDIIGMLKSELTKSRIHTAFARKLTRTIEYLDDEQIDDAVMSLIDNMTLIYPIFPAVMLLIQSVHQRLSEDVHHEISLAIRRLIQNDSHVVKADLNLAYAVRTIGTDETPENKDIIYQIYRERPSSLIRRDIILILAKWREWHWLSDLRNEFRTLPPWERRSFIIASYILEDEGEHWRRTMRSEFNRFEMLVNDWAEGRFSQDGWRIPI